MQTVVGSKWDEIGRGEVTPRVVEMGSGHVGMGFKPGALLSPAGGSRDDVPAGGPAGVAGRYAAVWERLLAGEL